MFMQPLQSEWKAIRTSAARAPDARFAERAAPGSGARGSRGRRGAGAAYPSVFHQIQQYPDNDDRRADREDNRKEEKHFSAEHAISIAHRGGANGLPKGSREAPAARSRG